MPVCPFCKKSTDKSANLIAVKNSDGKLTLACANCAKNHSLEPQLQSNNKKNSNTIKKAQNSINYNESFKKINSVLDEISEKNAYLENKKTYKREYERHDVDLEMQFSFLRDTKIFRATVLDISKGGIKFETDVPIKKGQHLRGVVFTPSQNETEINKVENYLDVRRVTLLENGIHQIGARFLKKIGVDDKDRRKHIRKKAAFPFYYKRKDSELINRGDVLDISPGGMRVFVHDEFEAEENIEIIMRTSPPSFVHADVRGYYQIIRTFNETENYLEAGGKFAKLIVTPLDKS